MWRFGSCFLLMLIVFLVLCIRGEFGLCNTASSSQTGWRLLKKMGCDGKFGTSLGYPVMCMGVHFLLEF